jgi:hypothetical protein
VELGRKYAEAMLVANKKDRPAAWDVGGYFKGVIRTVATTGEGVEQLRSEIRSRFGCENIDLKRARWWTERQRRELQQGNVIGGGGVEAGR